MESITPSRKYNLNNMNVAAQDIQLGDYLSELTDGYNKTGGSGTLMEDLHFSLTSGKQGVVDQPPFSTNEIAYLFPQNDSSQAIYTTGEMPDGWELGTDIAPHVHWKQTTAGSVVFKLDYKWFNSGDAIPGSFSTYIMDVPAYSYTTGSLAQISSGSAKISGSHIDEESSIILLKLYRDDNTYAGNAVTYIFDISIEMRSFGGAE